MSSSQYYPEKKLDSISAQNQPYPSVNYYPYPEPKNTFRLNPLVLSSLKIQIQMIYKELLVKVFKRKENIKEAKKYQILNYLMKMMK